MRISNYIKKWLTILEEMANDNTYKLAWGRGIIEICSDRNIKNDENVVITFQEIGKKMLKYYWNQIFYFNLKQTSMIKTRKPKMVQYTNQLINAYKEIYDTNQPIWFNKVYLSDNNELNKIFKTIIEKKIPRTLKSDVSWRFLKVKKTDDIGVYQYKLNEKYIILKSYQAKELKEYSEVLIQLFNYKWALLLEKYNMAPKIGNKVKGSGNETIKRKSLQQYKKLLLLQYHENDIRDFYTGEIIPENEISVDHVIPWSYIYDDDIWNLVITTKSVNSKKSNQLTDDYYIKKLEQRNEKLMEILEEKTNSKYINDLKYANENNTVREIYNYFKG